VNMQRFMHQPFQLAKTRAEDSQLWAADQELTQSAWLDAIDLRIVAGLVVARPSHASSIEDDLAEQNCTRGMRPLEVATGSPSP
jgi:hypothetical protein